MSAEVPKVFLDAFPRRSITRQVAEAVDNYVEFWSTVFKETSATVAFKALDLIDRVQKVKSRVR